MQRTDRIVIALVQDVDLGWGAIVAFGHIIGRDGITEKHVAVRRWKIDQSIIGEGVFRIFAVEDAAEITWAVAKSRKGTVKWPTVKRTVLTCPASAAASKNDSQFGGIAFPNPEGIWRALRSARRSGRQDIPPFGFRPSIR
ncbi:hypothetical protein GCM10011329_06550 [Stakelama pacifica]|nr:hypothetical protein GCM10011329_06550 [Stakelama pacifica]